MVSPLNPNIRTVSNCFGQEPVRPLAGPPATAPVAEPAAETPAAPKPAAAPVQTPPVPAVPSGETAAKLVSSRIVDSPRADAGAVVLADEFQVCEDEPTPAPDLAQSPVSSAAPAQPASVSFMQGSAGMNNQHGNAYLQGSMVTFQQVDGQLDPLDLLNAPFYAVGLDGTDKIELGNLNLEYGLLSQVNVQGSIARATAATPTVPGQSSAGLQSDVLQVGLNAGFVNPDGSSGVNLGVSADALKGTLNYSDGTGNQYAGSLGLGVGGAAYLGHADADKDGHSEITAGAEAEIIVGVGASVRSESGLGMAYDAVTGAVSDWWNGQE